LRGSLGEVKMHVASDADDSGTADRRSMLCHVAWIGSALDDPSASARRAFFLWKSVWSLAVPCGSMESEIYAVHAAIKDMAATRALLAEIGLHDGEATTIAVDSSSAKTVLQGEHSEKNSTGTKHIDRRVLGIRQQIAAGVYELVWIASEYNPADIGATFKSKVEFERLRTIIMGHVFARCKGSYLRDTEEPSYWSKPKSRTTPLLASQEVSLVE
jgi:hypothetical protein